MLMITLIDYVGIEACQSAKLSVAPEVIEHIIKEMIE